MKFIIGSKNINITQYVLALYVGSIIFANSTIYFYLCAAVLVICLGSRVFPKGIIKVSTFVILSILPIIYFLVCVLLGTTMFPEISLKRCAVMFMNLMINAMIADELRDISKRKRFLEQYCILALGFELYIMVCSGKNLLYGRLGSYAYSPIAYGGTYNANYVGVVLLFAILICFGFYLEDRKKNRLIRICIYVCGVLLTGSRKAIVSTAIILLLLPIVVLDNEGKLDTRKFVRYICGGFGICMVIALLLFKVPFLYNIAGYRVEAMLGIGTIDESSLNYRNLFIECAKEYFRSSPLIGIGIDNFSQVNIIKGYYAHNNYWELLAGGGVIGCILYYVSYVYLIVVLWKRRNDRISDISVFLVFMILMVFIDYYIVSYLNRICILFLFVANAAAHSKTICEG